MNEQANLKIQQELDHIRNEFAFDLVTLTIVQKNIEFPTLKWHYASGNLNNRYKRIVLQSGKGIAGIVYKTEKPLLMKNITQEVPHSELISYPIIISERLKSLGAIPLFHQGCLVAILLVAFRYEDGVTEELFREFKQKVIPEFESFYSEEMKSFDLS
ncbi:GAF domain-containing protein [Bacillus massiliigorillae]|uniref:GAF domain-containing protein n=1 Tax=Bacillus massiliigorillae TaxID=1243664 RepID=UPI0003A3E048|nr:GAF domain-containing protein [Bacillus massiliigorillae]